MQCCWLGASVLVRGSSGAIILYLWMAFFLLPVEAEVDPAWDNVFRTRNDEDWRAVWHTERHRRCYHDLYEHMNWVCQKDIYAVKRRKRSPSSSFPVRDLGYPPVLLQKRKKQQPVLMNDKEYDREDEDDYGDYPFLDAEKANSFLGSGPMRRRRHELYKRGIIDECCHATSGCSWEEYAEYCPANSRVRNS